MLRAPLAVEAALFEILTRGASRQNGLQLLLATDSARWLPGVRCLSTAGATAFLKKCRAPEENQ